MARANPTHTRHSTTPTSESDTDYIHPQIADDILSLLTTTETPLPTHIIANRLGIQYDTAHTTLHALADTDQLTTKTIANTTMWLPTTNE